MSISETKHSAFEQDCLKLKSGIFRQLKCYPLEYLRSVTGNNKASRMEINNIVYEMLTKRRLKGDTFTPAINLLSIITSDSTQDVKKYKLSLYSSKMIDYLVDYYAVKNDESLLRHNGRPFLEEIREYSIEQVETLMRINCLPIGAAKGDKNKLITRFLASLEFLDLDIDTTENENEAILVKEVDIFKTGEPIDEESVTSRSSTKSKSEDLPAPILRINRRR